MSKRTSTSGRRLWQMGGMGLAATAVAGVLYVLPATAAAEPPAAPGRPTAVAGSGRAHVDPAPVLRSGRDVLGALLERRVRHHRQHEGGQGRH
ncbi:hypothetical protein OG500_14930 [Kitasatospora sp. NBC_01250]|uniref:hypothetical protein n=1 Tax=unclassified Kitasatospora TaxID=2633591 RepID=UPI002E12E54B|nr:MULTISPECIES: hypothetical protein [unclassified Kitasatospora]WSJ67475.1 hypothetical protein OG294_15930 [Kitasatospora sp. NBC_01302]